MSLAYKLWKIGNALDEDDIKIAIKDEAEFEESKEPTYLNINFKIENDDITEIEFSDNAISYEKLFFSKKIGGSGGGMYYLYPNLNIRGVKSPLLLRVGRENTN
jgi:CRISPR-associated protein Csh1